MILPAAWRQELWSIAGLLALLWLVGLLTGQASWLVPGAVFIYLLWHLYHLRLLIRWVDNSSVQLPFSTPGIWGYVYYRLEVRRRKSASRKKQIGRLLKEFKASTRALPDATIVLNREFHIQWLNKAAQLLLGVRKTDAGQPVTNLIRHPDLQHYLDAGKFDMPLQLHLKSNGDSRLSLRVVPYGQQQYLLLARDVTEQHRIELMRRDFIANASHELRTPLSVLQGSIEQLEAGVGGNPELEKPLARMKHQSQRMMSILKDLLTLARLESRQDTGQQQAVSLSAVVAEVIEEARAASEYQGGHHFKLDIAEQVQIRGQHEDLYAAMSNLVMNAVHYTPAGGDITVALRAVPAGVRFEVADTGVGILPQHLARLTERFYRVDVGRSREAGGTGLGLSIVKHVLERYGSRLEISSRPGAGSIFAFTLPGKYLEESRPGLGDDSRKVS
jgi:two-component system phosphate regulon sensor histidine kinase PhoR